ncbi:hypothetical protein FJ251_00800 [bacterium]|nr:hypothetical protein [bacterium]
MRATRPAAPRALVCLLALVPLLASAAPAAEPTPLRVDGTPTNLGLAHSMAAEVAAASLAELGARAGDCLFIAPAAEHAGNGLLELALTEAARRQGIAPAPGPGDCARHLEFRILDLRIAYTGVDRSALWTRKEIERHGACIVACRLLDATAGSELAATQREVLMADRFPYALRELVASPSYPFTAPELKERDWSKSAEPFVVTGMVAALVYLFFSNQSSE